MLKSRISSGFSVQRSVLFVIGILLFSSLLKFSLAQNDYVYDSKGKRDPFIPLVSPAGVLVKLDKDEGTVASELKIEGIIFDKNGASYAIVGAKVVRVGDSITDGCQVLKIEQDKVIFIKEGVPLEIHLKEDSNNAK